MNLVELLVALVILTLGLLGLAMTSQSASRALMRARRTGVAAAQARLTVDSLRGRACAGTQASGGSAEQAWTITPGPLSIRYIRDSVEADLGGPLRRFVVEGIALCP